MALSPDGVAETIPIEGLYEIYPGKRLPEFDVGTASAYGAVELRDRSRPIYALLCDTSCPPRLEAIPALRRIDARNLVRVIDMTVIDWPGTGARRPVVLLDRPPGLPVMPSLDAQIVPFREEALVRRIIHPLVRALMELAANGVTHRNIRPDNLYFEGDDNGRSPVVLGECVATPPGFHQPAVYETLECVMADPAGRGAGSAANDIYALGVTLVALLTGRSPLHGKTDEEVVHAKKTQGSYAALLAEHKVSIHLMELLRGLLVDNPRDRWSLNDLEFWVAGRRLSPKHVFLPARAAQPFEIGGLKLHTARDVAEAFSLNWDAALTVVRKGMVDNWLRRSLNDEGRIEAVNLAKARGIAMDDGLIGRVCLALDPHGPIRFRGVRCMPDGLGTLLAAYINDETMRRDIADLFGSNVLQFRLELHPVDPVERQRLLATYERIRVSLQREAIGFGIDRVLYELNPALPCLSPLLAQDFVVELDALLPALERVAVRSGNLATLVDTHIAAFICARAKGAPNVDPHGLAGTTNGFETALAATYILAAVQDHGSGAPAPALCKVAARLLEPGIERYHNWQRRAAVGEALWQTVQSGTLRDIVRVIDDEQYLEADDRAYEGAVTEYITTVAELKRLDYERENRSALARSVGAELASLVSGVMATVAVLAIILFKIF